MLMGFYGLCLALILVMRLAPASALGRILLRQVVEAPLRRIETLERYHLIFLLLMVALLVAGSETLLMLGSFDVATLYLIDVSLYLDAMMATYVLAATVRGRSAWQALAGAIRPRLARRGATRRRRLRTERKPQAKGANDDDPTPVRLAA